MAKQPSLDENSPGFEFKIEELKFHKPSGFGTENYVKEFSEELLEKVLDEEEFKTYSEKRKRERESESDLNSPMPKLSKEDDIDEIILKVKQSDI